MRFFILFFRFFCCFSYGFFDSWDLKQYEDFFKNTPQLSDLEKKAQEKQLLDSISKTSDLQMKFLAYKNLVLLCKENLKYVETACFVGLDLLKIKNDDAYDTKRMINNLLVHLFKQYKHKDQKVKALLIYKHIKPYASVSYDALQKMTDMKAFRKRYPEYKDFFTFKVQKKHIESDKNPPYIWFETNHDLFDYSDEQLHELIKIFPKPEECDIKKTKNSISITHLNYGVEYHVSISGHLQNKYGEALGADMSTSLRISDQKRKISLSQDCYVLPSCLNGQIPVTTINVQSIDMTLYRIPDRNLNGEQLSEALKGWGTWQLKQSIGEELSKHSFDMVDTSDFLKFKNTSITKNIPFHRLVKNPKPGIYILSCCESSKSYNNVSQAVILTDLSLSCFKTKSHMLVEVRSFKKAHLIQNVHVQLIARNNDILWDGHTNHEGQLIIPVEALNGKGGACPHIITAYFKKDFCFLDLSKNGLDLTDFSIFGQKKNTLHDGFVTTERGFYRPGEHVYVTAFLRDGQKKAIASQPLILKMIHPNGHVFHQKILTGSDLGSYHDIYDIPTNARLGEWTISIHQGDIELSKTVFQVQEFTPNRMILSTTSSSQELFKDQETFVDLKASYLYGSPCPNVSISGDITIEKRPHFDKFKDYTFGVASEEFIPVRQELNRMALDPNGEGRVHLSIDTSKINSTHPLLAKVRLSSHIPHGQTQSDTLVYPFYHQSHYIGLKRDEHNHIHVVVIDHSQTELLQDGLEYSLFEEEIDYDWIRNGRYGDWGFKPVFKDHFVDKGVVKDKKIVFSSLSPYKRYRTEVQKGDVKSTIYIHEDLISMDASPEKMSIHLDSERVKDGETIDVHLTSPFAGNGMLYVVGDKIFETHPFTIEKERSLKIKMKKEYGAGVYLYATCYRPLKDVDESSPLSIPKRLVGIKYVKRDASNHQLKVRFEDKAILRPSMPHTIQFNIDGLTDDKVDVFVMAVDEGILNLNHFKSPDLFNYFYSQEQLDLDVKDLYKKLIMPIKGEVVSLRSGGDNAMLLRQMARIRKNPIIFSKVYSHLDIKNGQGSITLDVPDINTKIRLMAMVVSKNQVGAGDASYVVRDPVVVEMMSPSFLTKGDQTSMMVQIHTFAQPIQDGILSIKLGQKELLKQKISMEKHKRHQVMVPMSDVGEGTFDITSRLTLDDQNIMTKQNTITIRPQGPQVLRTQKILVPKTHGDEGFVIYQHSPQDIFKDLSLYNLKIHGNFEKDFSGKLYAISEKLLSYPYGCLEQLLSRGFGYGMGERFDELHSKILPSLCEFQNFDGGMGLWKNSPSDAFLTSYFIRLVSFLKTHHPESISFIPIKMFDDALDFLKGCVNDQTFLEQNTMHHILDVFNTLLNHQKINALDLVHYFSNTELQINDPLSLSYCVVIYSKLNDQDQLKNFKDRLKSSCHNAPIDELSQICLNILSSGQDDDEFFKSLLKSIFHQDLSRLSTKTMAILMQLSAYCTYNSKNTSVVLKDEYPWKCHNSSGQDQDFYLQAYGYLNEPMHKPEYSSMTMTRQILDLEGKPINLSRLKPNQRVIMLVEGEVTSPLQETNMILTQDFGGAFSAGLQPVTSLPNHLDMTTVSWIQTYDDCLMVAFPVKGQQFKIAFELQTNDVGTFNVYGTTCESVDLPSIYAMLSQDQVVIQ